MKHLKFSLFAICALLLLGGCSNKKEMTLSFSESALYFQWGGEAQTISYTATNLASITVKSKTAGWECVLNTTAQTVTVTPPKDPGNVTDRDTMRDCDIVFNLTAKNGDTSTSTFDCYIIGDSMIFVNEGGKYANSYVLTSPKSAYVIDVSKSGGGQPLSGVVDATIVWQSQKAAIEHLVYDDQKKTISFYVDAVKDENDTNIYIKENDDYVIYEANAVVAVVDGSDNILWSWHLWFSKEANNPLKDTSTYSNGVTFMNRNLGAFANSNGSTDQKLILGSYGLYYQWGRKDPFLRPFYYNCANNEEEMAYTGASNAIETEFAECSAETGTVEYTIAHPMTFITNAASVDAENGDGIGDWMYSPNSSLWSDTTKSAYDPCPYGWRVASGSDFDCLKLTAEEDQMPLSSARERFGWNLSDGTNSYFYTGAGLRSYYDGHIHNMNHKDGVYPSQPEPWEGYYWTTGVTTDNKQSKCMYFDLTTTRTINKFNLNYPSKRANAMQVRCVKID